MAQNLNLFASSKAAAIVVAAAVAYFDAPASFPSECEKERKKESRLHNTTQASHQPTEARSFLMKIQSSILLLYVSPSVTWLGDSWKFVATNNNTKVAQIFG